MFIVLGVVLLGGRILFSFIYGVTLWLLGAG
jgi:hypothetical protein